MGRNIVLIGFMGTGKSAVGRRLAKATHWPYFDLDKVIEQEQGATITEIFAAMGEEAFRAMETDVIERLSERRQVILSTGGGAPMREANMRLLQRNGFIVRLAASPELILQRVQPLDTRPMLANSPDPLKRIEELLAQREPFYEKADYTVYTDGKSLHEITSLILKAARSQ